MNDVVGTLKHLGYGELRLESSAPGGRSESEAWRPIEEVNGRFGTTDRTDILSRKNHPTCRLVDRETGELVATARKSCPIERAAKSSAHD